MGLFIGLFIGCKNEMIRLFMGLFIGFWVQKRSNTPPILYSEMLKLGVLGVFEGVFYHEKRGVFCQLEKR